MAKVHPVESELSKALDIKRKSGESDKKFQSRLHEAAMECDKAIWDGMTEAAQAWVNAVEAFNDHEKGKDGRSTYPKDYDDTAQSDPKPEKGKKKDKDDNSNKHDSNESKEDEDMSTKKKAAPAKKDTKKAAPAKKAKASNGSVGATPEWLKTLADIGTKGAKGATGAEIEKMCSKHGVRPFFARFVRAGFLDRVERGVYALTDKGKKLIKDNA